uniref:AraC-type arabinose-binding/dimerisation domain-containing protein n=1 Tax=Tanacetum cinerariifolium TaxID=118510 RepID=A0A699V0E3_TANCI|nr:hypothetical protein [Tanacetum cinerariifolium]
MAHRYGADDASPWTIYWLHFAGQQAAALYKYLGGEALGEPVSIAFADERLRLFEAIFAQLMLLPAPDSLKPDRAAAHRLFQLAQGAEGLPAVAVHHLIGQRHRSPVGR